MWVLVPAETVTDTNVHQGMYSFLVVVLTGYAEDFYYLILSFLSNIIATLHETETDKLILHINM